MHLVLSLLLGAFVYSPLREVSAFAAVVQLIVFPAMTLSGVWMWQQGRIARWSRRAAQ
jgi:hypothetical protein